ncbi:MAG TPA: glycerol-3-phosphate dehydrogenase, partial [Gammaproteobacteria bacterium]|nr:glycerol-3-phosphate dehydrogenase [Gammaproteobacteria bacterium]
GDDAPVLNVFGGKLTAYRQLAEKSLDRLLPLLDESRPAWTATACLPGGDLPNADWQAFLEQVVAQWPDLPQPLLHRCARQYGTRIQTLLAGVTTLVDLGEAFGGDMYAREVAYLVQHEWARTAEDILWRRTRQGLHAPETTAAAIEQFLRNTST